MVANNQNQAKRTKRKGNAKWVKGMTSPNPHEAPGAITIELWKA
jgi:hypothetical protein